MKRILLLEDNPGDVRLLKELLNEYGSKDYEMEQAGSIEQALYKLTINKYDLLLLDLSLPDGSGLDTVKRVVTAAAHSPIVVLTGMEDDRLAIEAVQAGAQDYLVKGQVNGSWLARTMNHAIERQKMQERINFLAHHDGLTRLPNCELFYDRLNTAINRSRRFSHKTAVKWELAVMVIDLDHFKEVNDRFGHPQGDILLQEVADRLRNAIRQTDTVARMGGDEFMLIFENVSGQEDAAILGQRVLNVFNTPFLIAGREISISASMGIGLYPNDGETYEALIHIADTAMYKDKRTHNRINFIDGSSEPA